MTSVHIQCELRMGTRSQDGSLLANPVFHFLFARKLPVLRETAWFIVLSLVDIGLTAALLSRGTSDMQFVEANPLARYFLDGGGLRSLVYFKCFMVAFAVVVCQIIALKRKKLARRVLQFAIVAVSGVVVYSAILLMRSHGAM